MDTTNNFIDMKLIGRNPRVTDWLKNDYLDRLWRENYIAEEGMRGYWAGTELEDNR